jgi:RNA-directed DNA polymerase
MGRLAKRIQDARVLGLIRRYLEAGMLAGGVVMERHEGTPQGGPLSPLLANVLLDEVDKELEQRGHAFVRYADDCNVYLHSRRAAERVMQLLERLFRSLRLRINETKSAVALVWGRKFLGYCFRKTRTGDVQRAVAPKALAALKESVRAKTSRTGGRSLVATIEHLAEFLRGWKAYFRLAEQRSVLEEAASRIDRAITLVRRCALEPVDPAGHRHRGWITHQDINVIVGMADGHTLPLDLDGLGT